MSNFFINRPIVAMVIAILTVLGGLIALRGLPLAQFPEIVPPQIIVSTTYTGADAVTIEQSVSTPLEQQMNGVDNMLYMQSTNANDGTAQLTVTFGVETDVSLDQVNVQNRVAQAPNLPTDVNQYGLTTRKSTGLPMLIISISPNNTYDALFLANYATININDVLYRVPGVGEVRLFGASDYAMRIWVKPDVLAKLELAVPDLAKAVQQQSTVNPAGQVGAAPAPEGIEKTYTVRAQGRLQTPEEFGQHRRPLQPGRLRRALADGPDRTVPSTISSDRARTGSPPPPSRSFSPAPMRWPPRTGSNACSRTSKPVPRRPRLRDHARHDAAGDGGHPRDRPHALRGHAPGHSRRLHLLAELAGDAHSPDCRAGVAHRYLRGVSVAGVLDQHTSLFAFVLAIGLVVDDAIVVVEAWNSTSSGAWRRARPRSRRCRRSQGRWSPSR